MSNCCCGSHSTRKNLKLNFFKHTEETQEMPDVKHIRHAPLWRLSSATTLAVSLTSRLCHTFGGVVQYEFCTLLDWLHLFFEDRCLSDALYRDHSYVYASQRYINNWCLSHSYLNSRNQYHKPYAWTSCPAWNDFSDRFPLFNISRMQLSEVTVQDLVNVL